MSQYALAKAIDAPRIRISAIVNGERTITPDTAPRLARYFRASPEFWMGMQATHDLEIARDRVGARIEAKRRPRAA
jgi:addiction module HigA family antidote